MSTSRRKVLFPQFGNTAPRRLSQEESRAEDLALIKRLGKDYNRFVSTQQAAWGVTDAAIQAADKRLRRV